MANKIVSLWIASFSPAWLAFYGIKCVFNFWQSIMWHHLKNCPSTCSGHCYCLFWFLVGVCRLFTNWIKWVFFVEWANECWVCAQFISIKCDFMFSKFEYYFDVLKINRSQIQLFIGIACHQINSTPNIVAKVHLVIFVSFQKWTNRKVACW